MSSPRSSRHHSPSFPATVVALAVLAGGALGACGGSTQAGAGASTPATTASTPSTPSTPTPSPTPSATPTPTSPATSTTPSATATRAAGAALLSAAELPRVAGGTAWTQAATGPAGSEAFGLCQKFDLLTIGAERAVQRTFTDTAGNSAGQQVADFPDAQNTVRATSVLEAWHRDCAGRVQGTHVHVGAITPVATSSGRAWWYLVSYQRNGTAHAQELGVVVTGARMTLLTLDPRDPRGTYPTGQDPMQLAVKAAAAKLV